VKSISIALVLVVAGLLAAGCGGPKGDVSAEDELARTKRAADGADTSPQGAQANVDMLNAAVEAYEEAKGQPAPSLDALVPEFIDAIPTPPPGEEWDYDGQGGGVAY